MEPHKSIRELIKTQIFEFPVHEMLSFLKLRCQMFRWPDKWFHFELFKSFCRFLQNLLVLGQMMLAFCEPEFSSKPAVFENVHGLQTPMWAEYRKNSSSNSFWDN